MHYEEIVPSPHLRHLVKCFWALRDDPVVGGPPETVLPDGSLEIIFNLADRFRRFHSDGQIETQPSAIVVGQMRKFIQIQPTGKVDLFGVRFETAGAYHFFRRPLSELTDHIVELDPLVQNGEKDLESRICDASGTSARVTIFEASLTRKLRSPTTAEHTVEGVKRQIHMKAGSASIRDMSRDLGVSQRQIERHFKQMVGVTPKFYSRIIRLQSILNSADPNSDMLELALSHGYYDQAHFIHEFTEFAGKSPTAFLRDENRMAEAFLNS